MDWISIRVLTKNLKELLAEIELGTHISNEFGSVRASWRIGLLTITSSLMAELGWNEDTERIHPSFETLSWPNSEEFERNPYIKMARSTLEVAEKLIADFDTECERERSRSALS